MPSLSLSVPAVAQASDGSTVVAETKAVGIVNAVTYTPTADITGAATNNRTVSLVNKGQDGSGTTVIATLAFGAGVTASDFDERDITVSATAANRKVNNGDVLAWVSTHVGSGIADPGGLVQVDIAGSWPYGLI